MSDFLWTAENAMIGGKRSPMSASGGHIKKKKRKLSYVEIYKKAFILNELYSMPAPRKLNESLFPQRLLL